MSTTSTSDTPKDDIKSRKIGALWIKSSASGNKYLTGELQLELDGKKHSIMINVLKSNFKVPGDRRPDYEIVRQHPVSATETSSAPQMLDPEAGI